MCTALFTQKPQTIVRDPKEATLPVPPASPEHAPIGTGAAKKAIDETKRRRVRQAIEIEKQTQ